MRSLAPRGVVLVTSLVTLLFIGLPAATVDSVTPSALNVSLQPGQSATIDKTLHLDALPGKADIVLAIDTTGSMGADHEADRKDDADRGWRLPGPRRSR